MALGVMSKTLIIQNLQGIGDTVWFVRNYHAIARSIPEQKVSILTRPRSMADQILKDDPFIDQVLWLKMKPGIHDGLLGIWRLARLIRQHKFERVWILHSRSLRYALACRLAGVKYIYGSGIGLQRYLLSHSLPLLKEEQKYHPIRRGTLLLKRNGLSLDLEKSPLFVGDAERQFAHEKIHQFPKPWIGLGIASSEVHKKWSWQNYAALGLALHKKQGGTFFIMGAGLEIEESQHIAKVFKENKVPYFAAVNFSISQSLALLQSLDFTVGNDTGILHAAPMVGSKGLVLLGCGQVPIHDYAEVEGLRFSAKGIHEITVDDVLEKLTTLGWV
jgi:heptosyltransferase-2